jgi:hypothetical protein
MNKELPPLYGEQSASPLQHFTRLVKTPYEYIKFYFNRIHTAEGVQYHISCKAANQKIYSIQMAEILWRWHITPATKCPRWIKELEPAFEKTILESLIGQRT